MLECWRQSLASAEALGGEEQEAGVSALQRAEGRGEIRAWGVESDCVEAYGSGEGLGFYPT